MFSLSSLFDLERLSSTHEVSLVVVQSGILAFLISAVTALLSYRMALRKQSKVLFWLGNFATVYSIWNVFFLSAYAEHDIHFSDSVITPEGAHRAHLFLGLILPFIAHRFLSLFFARKNLLPHLSVWTAAALVGFFLVPLKADHPLLKIGVGLFVFGSFMLLVSRLWSLYRTTDDLKLKTRSFFVLVGIFICTVFSLVGQMRAENIYPIIPLPFVGNIFTAVLILFSYRMVLNPRLREVRELMLRGIRVLVLAIILTGIFLLLLAWVGENNLELFIFNTFIASFFILMILEPLRKNLDLFFLKQFIIDRYEFEEILKKLPKKLRGTRNVEQLAHALIAGIKESERIYQTALFLWDPAAREFRLVAPSNLAFKNTLELDHAFVRYFTHSRSPLILEQDQEYPKDVREALRELHSHIVLPLFKQDELLGLWALRSSLRSTNPYTSFSDDEVQLLELVTQDVIMVLEQLQHFQSQERQERLAALGEMSAALAHEIRNPLGAIQGASQLLATSPTLKDAEDQECVDILRKEIDRMQRTVDQYLNFARKSEDPIAVSLQVLVKKVIHDVQPKAVKTHSTLHQDVSAEIPSLLTDPLKVEQVLFNLVQNACEAFSKNVWVNVSLAKDHLEITVKDDGPGMSPAVLTNIFTPLFTTKSAGSGLGLPICKKIIDSLGGRISVESRLNEGTTFKILLPYDSEKEKRTFNADEAAPPEVGTDI